ncbi:MAG: DUF983 domain-containing protein [Alphaproteobacteria bacterium]|nr:DUF983 domain-containing protein [Alphaproteobacteria bacterium]
MSEAGEGRGAPLAPFLRGLRGRCARCGEGALFVGFLKLAPRCPVCGYDLTTVDSGDGPAVFVILFAGFIVVFAALITELIYDPPVWVDLAVWLPIGAAVCLGLLRPMKGLMIAAQMRNRGERPPP